MLALVLDPNDRRALLEVLRGPWAGVSDRTLVGLTDPGQGLAAPGDGWEHGERRRLVEEGDVEHLRRLREVVLELHHAHDRLGPARVLREAVAALALEDTLAALPRGAQRVANVRKLLALAERDADCPTFARRLADAMARDAPEAEAATFSESDDAVRLLTVHASKGLSFPIVFVPQMGAAAAWRGTGPFALEIGDARGPTRLAVRVVASDGALLDPPSFARARAADRRRTEAERRRLLYVAMTRASRAMFLVGDRPPARSETAASSPVGAFALADIAATEDRARAACLLVEEVEPARPAERLATSPAPATAPAVQGPEIRPSWRTLPIAPTLLADFHHCPRRFELLHVLGLPESPRGAALAPKEAASADVDARREGTLAHAVLERIDVACFGRPGAREEISRLLENEGLAAAHPRHEVVLERVLGFIEGAYAARIARARARVLREHPFVMEVPDDAGRVVSLRGSVDLVVLWPDGAVDVVDYKRARGPSPAPYAFQLGVYALAVRDFVRDDKALRAGIVFLGGARAEPAWLADLDVDAQRREIAALGELVMEARWSGRFPRVELERCRAIRCGYVRSCHP
jgi:ATP-dependent helicase/nuclease subunit A